MDVFENEVKGHFSLAPLSMRDIKQSEERANYCCNTLESDIGYVVKGPLILLC